MRPEPNGPPRRTAEEFLLRTPRGNVALALGLLGLAGIGLAVYHGFSLSLVSLFPPCPTYALLHLRCPACGGTRALESFLHGDVLSAFYYNPVLTLLFLLGVALWGWILFNGLRRPYRPLRAPFSFTAGKGLLLGGILVAFFIVRNLPFYPLMR